MTVARSSTPSLPSLPALPDGLVAVVKEACPACQLVAPVLEHLADVAGLVVYTQDDPSFPTEADWVIDVGPGAGAAGGSIVVAGSPQQVARKSGSRTAPFLARELARVE